MKKLFASGTILCLCLNTIPQNSFQNSITTGFFFPVKNDAALAAHNGKGMHFGNHFDYLLGERNFKIGLGGYAGQLVAFDMTDYKETAQQLATKYRLGTDKLKFKEAPFRSAAVLMGPVVDWKMKRMNANLWAKGGYGINEPGRFSATVQDAGAVSNVYSNQAGDAKNNFTYSIGGGIRYNITSILGLQLAANYFNTKTELVNFNYEREKGTAPYTFSANNNFIQANLGVSISLNGKEKERTRKEMAVANTGSDPRKNDNDTIYFVPKSVIIRQTQGTTFGEKSLHPINNYLTAFLYNTDDGTKISQCSGMKTPGDPIPGLDVKLKNTTTNQTYSIHTNEDGSFAVKDITDGIYHAITANDTAVFAIENASSNPDYRLVQNAADECGSVTSHVIYAEDKMFAEVIRPRDVATGQSSGKRMVAPRDVATGQSSGKRMHQPLPVVNTSFHLNFNNIIRVGDLLYAEVITAREAGSGMASGKRTIATGDVDGDGMADKIVEKTPGGVKQTMQTQVLVLSDDSGNEVAFYEVKAPRDLATGQSSGKRINTSGINNDVYNYEVKAPRDVATGQSSGKRIYSGSNTTQAFEYDVKAPRDVATGQSSGKRMAQTNNGGQGLEYNVESPKDIIAGQASGKMVKHDEGYQPWDNNDLDESVVNNPLYGQNGQGGANPMYEKRFTVQGSSGNKKELIVPLLLNMSNTAPMPGIKYEVSATNLPLANKATVNTSRSNIKHSKMAMDITDTEAGPNKATISTTRSNIKNHGLVAVAMPDPYKPSATINTTRSNIKSGKAANPALIKNIENIHCANGSCTAETLVLIDGIMYEATIAGVLKTKHDTVKNTIGNIR